MYTCNGMNTFDGIIYDLYVWLYELYVQYICVYMIYMSLCVTIIICLYYNDKLFGTVWVQYIYIGTDMIWI